MKGYEGGDQERPPTGPCRRGITIVSLYRERWNTDTAVDDPTTWTTACSPWFHRVRSQDVRTLLPAGLLDLGGHADTDQPVVGLELLHGLGGVVDEGKASGLATTVLSAEAEDVDLVAAGLVEATQLLAELILGDVRAVGVQDVTERKKRQVSKWQYEKYASRICKCPASLASADQRPEPGLPEA